MDESPNRSNPGQKILNLPMEVRLLLAFLLMGLVVYLTPLFQKTPPVPIKPPAPPPAAQIGPAPEKSPETPADKPPANAPAKIAAEKEQDFLVQTNLYTIHFSNRGASVRSWQLRKFSDQTGDALNKPLELVNQAALAKVPPPFSIWTQDDKIAGLLNFAYFAGKQSDDKLSVSFEFSDGSTVCRKSFEFTRDSYLWQFRSEVTRNNVPVAHLVEWRGGFGDLTVASRGTSQHAVHYDLDKRSTFGVDRGTLVTQVAKDARDHPLEERGNYSFVGLDDAFFAFVALPRDNASTETIVFKDDVLWQLSKKEEAQVGAAIGGDSLNRFPVFTGPKDVDVLARIDPKLQQLIDWGWFWFIAKPLFQTLHYLNDHLVHNYGWSIVFITIVINLVLLPFRLTSMKSARKMQSLQPQIAAINAKYKSISLRDPRKADQNQEIMDLYKKHGANPLGGCLPMVIQLPILWAFYKVLTVTIEMRGAHWLWVTDLSQPEKLALHVLPIVMIVTQFFMQKMTPNPTMDPSQARIMQFMPLMFGIFFYNMSSGLVLYWLTSNLIGIGQQLLINKYTPAPVVEAPRQPALKKVSRR